MCRIGFLACETTLPGAGERRGDAYEHDLMVAAIEPALLQAGLELQVIDWEAPIEAFDGIDLVLLGTAWNYQDKSADFLARLDALSERGITVCNPPDVVRWNVEKTYLKQLADNGARTIPTVWLDHADAAQARATMDHFGCDRMVVKRQIGAGALGQELLQRGEIADDWAFPHKAMLQPFLPAIGDEGEISFIFIDGALSHALTKQPAKGDYRIQSLYGGIETAFEPEAGDTDQACAIIDALPFPAPLYARIDMLRDHDGALMVMEAELIEPYLYPEQGDRLGQRLAAAIAKRLR